VVLGLILENLTAAVIREVAQVLEKSPHSNDLIDSEAAQAISHKTKVAPICTENINREHLSFPGW
jgi:hypothetical protein